MNKDIDNLFFELIRVAIGNQVCLSHTPSADEWGELYAMAKKQSLVGICFAGVQRLQAQRQSPPEMLYLQWMGMAAKILQRNELANERVLDLQKKLSSDGHICCVLKGQGISTFYGDQLCGLRQTGDIDVWVNSSKDLMVDYVMKQAPTRDITRKHIEFPYYKDVEVEIHWVPACMDNLLKDYELKNWFRDQWNLQYKNSVTLQGNKSITTPTAAFNLVYLLLHLYEHVLYEGVGMRQLMDYYFVIKAVNGDSHEIEDNIRIIKKLGLMSFAESIAWVLVEVFGLEESEVPWRTNPDNGRVLLQNIMEGGNVGAYREENRRKNESNTEWFLRRMKQYVRSLKLEPTGVIFRPLYRLKQYCWTMNIYKKYNL